MRGSRRSWWLTEVLLGAIVTLGAGALGAGALRATGVAGGGLRPSRLLGMSAGMAGCVVIAVALVATRGRRWSKQGGER